MENIDPPQLNNYNKKNDAASNASPQAAREQIATNVKGAVKWFHRVKGFGFITRDDTNEDVFVHYTSLKPVSINLMRAKKRLNLMDKEKVQFDVVQTAEGFEAVNVVGKNGYLILDIIAYKRDIPPFDLEIINDARVTGKVKWFNVKIKYGFIHCDYNNEDVFVHSSAIIKNNPSKYKPSLSENEPVEFDILKIGADGKLEAVNVSGPQGQSVQGSRFSPDKKDVTDKVFSEQNIAGKVKWFNVKAGFGFINRNDDGTDVYAHYSAIVNKNPNHRVRSLADGEQVMFNIIQGTKGAEACDITGVDGGTVQGSEYARPKNLNNSQTASSYRGSKNNNQDNFNRRGDKNFANESGANLAPPIQNSYRNQRQNTSVIHTGGGSGPKSSDRNNNNESSSFMQQQPPNNQNKSYMQPNGGGTGRVNVNNSSYASNHFVEQNHYSGLNRQRYDNEPRQHPNQHMGNIFHNPQPIRNQQYSYNSSNNGFLNSNSNLVNQGGFDVPHVQNGYMNQRQPQNQYHYHQSNQVAVHSHNNMGGAGAGGGGLGPAGILLDERVSGFVKWYNFKNGFGFVTRNDNHQDIFVHRSGIISNSLPGLDDGEPVQFDVYQDGNRVLAVNVIGPNGTSLRGSKFAANNMPGHPSNLNAPNKVYRRREKI
jgi:cold shock CspA family protein